MIVSWAYKQWTDFTDQDKLNLQQHLSTMDKAAREKYTNYLIKHEGVNASTEILNWR